MTVRIESQAEPIPGYRLLDRLGSGGFGEVWRAEAPGGIYKAIKVIHGDLRNRETDSFRFAEQELKALKRVKQVRHPYLLALDRYDIIEGRLLITMELAEVNLWDRFRQCRKAGLPGIPREELLLYMTETAEVLDLFNDKFQLQHLDIKPQNLLTLCGHVKVADFGQVKDLEGLMAQVTGGITPVYAAPETFDGVVSRYCDQYSLACVYQELLTGQRPFDGTSMQQLLMQHLQMPPNLDPAPPCDRPALRTALAKKHDERFPTVAAFVKALRQGSELPRPGGGAIGATAPVAVDYDPLGSPPLTGMPSGLANSLSAFPPAGVSGSGSGLGLAGLSGSGSLSGSGVVTDTPTPRGLVETAPPPIRPAPPLETGPGCLRPVVVVGLGYTGLRVLHHFRQQLVHRFGSADNTPCLRTLYIDTDPDTLAAATDPVGSLGRLHPDEVFAAPLRRPTHYLKTRSGGRTILDGWFDPQLLYKMPRTPATQGLRALGRLAYMDHARPIGTRLQAELEAVADPNALSVTQEATGLELRTNRPRVVIVAGLGGGTGSGMAIDIALTARARLRRLGYHDADVTGLLLVPPDTADVPTHVQANTYAALTELNHFARSNIGFSPEADVPWTDVFLLPGMIGTGSRPGATPTSPPPWARTPGAVNMPSGRSSGLMRGRSGVVRNLPRPDPEVDPTEAAATHLRLHLFTQAGRCLDEVRPARIEDTPLTVLHVAGVAQAEWPRAEVVTRTQRVLMPVLVNQWVNPDPAQVREVIPAWAAEQWSSAGLSAADLTTELLHAASVNLNLDLPGTVQAGVERLSAKGWRTRTPEANAVATEVDRWQALLGHPNAPAGRTLAPAAVSLAAVADARFNHARQIAQLFPPLIETPHFRLAGTEEAVRQVLSHLERSCRSVEQTASEQGKAAASALGTLLAFAHHQKGLRKPTPAELTEAIRIYPQGQLAALTARAVARVYRQLKDVLVALLGEIAAARQRLEVCLPGLAAAAEAPIPATQPSLLPPGCSSAEDAAQTFLHSLTDDDLSDLDAAVQAGLEHRFGGLYQACMNTGDETRPVLAALRDDIQAYLNQRLGEVDFAAMWEARSGPDGVDRELRELIASATPRVVGAGPWSREPGLVFLAPDGPGGDPLRDRVAELLPTNTPIVAVTDEAAVVCEYSDVPIAALPQLGTQWAAAYRSFADTQQATPHTRLDVPQWLDVDAV